MKKITCITLSNANNRNETSVCTLATPEAIRAILLRNGWFEVDTSVPNIFEKDRVFVTLEQKSFIEDAQVALNYLL